MRRTKLLKRIRRLLHGAVLWGMIAGVSLASFSQGIALAETRQLPWAAGEIWAVSQGYHEHVPNSPADDSYAIDFVNVPGKSSIGIHAAKSGMAQAFVGSSTEAMPQFCSDLQKLHPTWGVQWIAPAQYIIIKYDDGTKGGYWHLGSIDKDVPIYPTEPKHLEQGRPLGNEGRSGCATHEHLHYVEWDSWGTNANVVRIPFFAGIRVINGVSPITEGDGYKAGDRTHPPDQYQSTNTDIPTPAPIVLVTGRENLVRAYPILQNPNETEITFRLSQDSDYLGVHLLKGTLLKKANGSFIYPIQDPIGTVIDITHRDLWVTFNLRLANETSLGSGRFVENLGGGHYWGIPTLGTPNSPVPPPVVAPSYDPTKAPPVAIYGPIIPQSPLEAIYHQALAEWSASVVAAIGAAGPSYTRMVVYVSNRGDATLSKFDASGILLKTIPLDVESYPSKAVIDEARKLIYVPLSEKSAVAILDQYSDTILAKIPVGVNPMSLVIEKDRNIAFVANKGSNALSVLNLDSSQRTEIARIPVCTAPMDVNFTPDKKELWVVCALDHGVAFVDTTTLTLAGSVFIDAPVSIAMHPSLPLAYVSAWANTITIISRDTRRVIGTIATGISPAGMAIDPDANRLWVANRDSNDVRVFSLSDGSLVKTIPLPNTPFALSFDKTTGRVFVTQLRGQALTLIDGNTFQILKTLPTGLNPYDVAIGEE